MTDADEPRMGRRAFWRAAARGLAAARQQQGARRVPARAPAPARRTPAPATRGPLRPPGALPEPFFQTLCAPGCRMCVDACPRYAIVPSLDTGQPGGGDGRPYLVPDQAACDLCGLCMPACPTGALVTKPGEDVRIGLAVLEAEACLRTQGQPCDVCLERCPYPGVALKDAGGLPTVIERACTGCGLCAEACPPHAFEVIARATR